MTKSPMSEPQHLPEGASTEPPHSDEAGQAVIGSLLIDNNAFDDITGTLTAEHFYRADHREIFATIAAIITGNKMADVLTVHERGKHDVVLLTALSQCVASPRNALRYAEIVRNAWAKRQIIHLSHDTIAAAFNPAVEASVTAANAQELLAKIAQGQARSVPRYIGDLMPAHLDRIIERGEGKDRVYPTGLLDLDKLLSGGLRPGHLIVIAARPSMGKTTIGMSIARHVAQSAPVLVLSQEMTSEQLLDANVAALGHVELDKVMKPDPLDAETWSRISDGADRAGKLNLLIDTQPAMRVIDVRSKILSAKRKAGSLAVVVVDYIQLMRGEGGENRNAELDQIVNALKALALDHAVCIIALAQCNREADRKPDGADSMSDIRDSGAIEAAGDVVCMLHREFVRSADPRLADYGQLRVVKNRFGPTARVNLFFNGRYQFFGSWAGSAPTATSGKGGKSSGEGFY